MSDVTDELAPSLSSGGGNFFENLASDFANSIVKVSTGGDMGYKDGKLTGTAFRNLSESLGEVTGRNQARKANMDAKQQLVEEKAAKDQETKNSQTMAMFSDINASNYAGAVRQSADQQTKRLLGGDISKDFLGL